MWRSGAPQRRVARAAPKGRRCTYVLLYAVARYSFLSKQHSRKHEKQITAVGMATGYIHLTREYHPMVYYIMPYEVKILPRQLSSLIALSDRLRAKAVRSIVLLRELGPLLREPHAKKVTDWKGLFELRVALGGDTCRLFYFWHGARMVVVTSGYMKKGMKLERRELERATSLMNGYLASGGEDL